MTLSGSFRWVADPDADPNRPHLKKAPRQFINSDGKAVRHIWSGNLSNALSVADDLKKLRLGFSVPAEISPYKNGALPEIPMRITKQGAIHYGRIGPRPAGKGPFPYKRRTRFRWKDTRWRINDRGLWLLDPGPVDEKLLSDKWPEYLLKFLSELERDPKQAISDHWNIAGQCALCGKNIISRLKIHEGCANYLPTLSSL